MFVLARQRHAPHRFNDAFHRTLPIVQVTLPKFSTPTVCMLRGQDEEDKRSFASDLKINE